MLGNRSSATVFGPTYPHLSHLLELRFTLGRGEGGQITLTATASRAGLISLSLPISWSYLILLLSGSVPLFVYFLFFVSRRRGQPQPAPRALRHPVFLLRCAAGPGSSGRRHQRRRWQLWCGRGGWGGVLVIEELLQKGTRQGVRNHTLIRLLKRVARDSTHVSPAPPPTQFFFLFLHSPAER